jgi:dihydroxyacetone kinase-like predicted kinase
MGRYFLEFILNMHASLVETLKNSLIEFGEGLEISRLPLDDDAKGEDFKIRIYTEDPTVIFDTCAQFGRLKSIKVEEKHY